MKCIKVFGLLSFMIFGSCQKKESVILYPNDVLFEQVGVIPITSNKIFANRNVIVRDRKVYRILANETIINKEAATIIDGIGKYLAPGLTDMHAHVPLPNPENDNAEEVLFLYLANGVTTIRMMAGYPGHLMMREKVRSGKLLGPRIFLSGPAFDKSSATSLALVDSMARNQKAMGYDFLKIRSGVDLVLFDQLVKAAKEIGMTFSGHVPVDVGIHHALKSGYSSIEHLDGYIEGMIPDSLNLDPNGNGYFGFNYINYPNMDLLDELVTQTVTNKVWNTPTQRLLELWGFAGSSEELAMAPEMKYVSQRRIENWIARRNRELIESNYTKEKGEKFLQIRRTIIKTLNDSGQRLLAGSDPPQVFIVPGFSIHQEMQAFLNAGLSNYEAIKTATVNTAGFFKRQGEFGEISEGASADLILLDSNPLENLENYSSIQGVMYRGEWLSKKSIDHGLLQIEKKYKDH